MESREDLEGIQRFKSMVDPKVVTYSLAGNSPAGDSPEGEMVNHPAHYTPGPYEVFKVLLAWGLHQNAHLYQAVKYISRCGKKTPDALQDLKKAHWWLGLEIWILEGKDPNDYHG